MPTVLFIDGRRVEIRIRSYEEMLQEARSVFDQAKMGRRAVRDISEEALDRCQRFLHAIPLRKRPLIDSLREQISERVLVDIITEWFSEQAREAFRCAAALLAVGQEPEAVGWARSAAALGLKAVLARNGESYLAKKWASQQIERVRIDSKLRAHLLALESPKKTNKDGAAYIEHVASALQELSVAKRRILPADISLRRRPGVTTWQIGSQVHVIVGNQTVYALNDDAGAAWRSMVFYRPVVEWLGKGRISKHGAGRLIAEFHRLGLVDMHSREAGVIRARSISSVAPSTNSPILSIDGIIWSRGEKASIVRAAIPAVDFAAAGMELIYVNMVIENAREDALGALRAMQWAVFERSIRRMLRFVSRAILSAAGISPLPAVEEGYLHLSTLVFIPAEIERKICEMEDALVVANEEDAHRALHDVDDITVKVRNLIHSGLFPSSFLSPTDWQKTLDIGYDWARLGAFLDADFPLEQARDLVATGGHQPAIKSVQVEVA